MLCYNLGYCIAIYAAEACVDVFSMWTVGKRVPTRPRSNRIEHTSDGFQPGLMLPTLRNVKSRRDNSASPISWQRVAKHTPVVIKLFRPALGGRPDVAAKRRVDNGRGGIKRARRRARRGARSGVVGWLGEITLRRRHG